MCDKNRRTHEQCTPSLLLPPLLCRRRLRLRLGWVLIEPVGAHRHEQTSSAGQRGRTEGVPPETEAMAERGHGSYRSATIVGGSYDSRRSHGEADRGSTRDSRGSDQRLGSYSKERMEATARSGHGSYGTGGSHESRGSHGEADRGSTGGGRGDNRKAEKFQVRRG